MIFSCCTATSEGPLEGQKITEASLIYNIWFVDSYNYVPSLFQHYQLFLGWRTSSMLLLISLQPAQIQNYHVPISMLECYDPDTKYPQKMTGIDRLV